MVDWQMLEGVGGVATAIAVIVALAFGVAQLRQATVQRHELATAELLAHMLSPEIVRALDRIVQLPVDAPPEAIAEDPSLRQDVRLADFTLEGAGVLVYERRIPLHDIDRMMGGMIRLAWSRVRAYTLAERERLGSQSIGEWWQWIVERMDEDPAPGKHEGAHIAFRAWRR
jgi:hypothetical protein